MVSTRTSSRKSTQDTLVNSTDQDDLFKDHVFSLTSSVQHLERLITGSGGTVHKSLTKKVTLIVASSRDVQDGISKTITGKAKGIPIVSQDFVLKSIEASILEDVTKHVIQDTTPVKDDPNQVAQLAPSKSKSKGKKKAVEEDIENVQPPAKKVKEEEPPKMVTEIVKGAAAVDTHCPYASYTHVVQAGSDIYDAMLNQTNIENNNNKFYLLQVLKHDSQETYYTWFRWGRVGQVGQNSQGSYSTLASAVHVFSQKFKDKTKNDWNNRHNFEKVKGKYFILERDYGSSEPIQETKPDNPKAPQVESKLANPVQDLMKLIFNVSMMEMQMKEIGYDAKKLPLGKLSKRNVQMGYDKIAEIGEELKKPNASRKILTELSSDFYTIIPHIFGMSRPPVIDTMDNVRSKLDMLQALADIQIATSLIKEAAHHSNIHPLDSKYESLRCDLKPISKDGESFKVIQTYVKNTHAATHSEYRLDIMDVFDVSRDGESDRFAKDVSNKMLLWHGSRLTNFVGILSQGLRIAPPEAPVTGYMFGKGIYFADMVSKSANYCFTSRHSNEGLLLLCEVLLGNPCELVNANYDAHKHADFKNYHSVKGVGKTMPDPSMKTQLGDAVVPYGPGVSSNVAASSLLYNEYIVYRLEQVRIKYLVRVKFNYK